jgi:hypothetical protein
VVARPSRMQAASTANATPIVKSRSGGVLECGNLVASHHPVSVGVTPVGPHVMMSLNSSALIDRRATVSSRTRPPRTSRSSHETAIDANTSARPMRPMRATVRREVRTARPTARPAQR